MPQTLTDLFNNLSLAGQPVGRSAPALNGTISAPSSSVVSSSAQTALPTAAVGPNVPQYNGGNVFIQPAGGFRPVIFDPATNQGYYGSLPTQKIPNIGLSIADPNRNTATTRVIG